MRTGRDVRPESGSFDLLAKVYDALAFLVFGRSLQAVQTALPPLVPDGSRVLILGGGSGWILSALLQHRHPGEVVYLEASAGMLEQARRRLKQPGCSVQFVHGDTTALAAGATFDVLLTPFVLDLYQPKQVESMFRELDQMLKTGGWWLFADFRRPAGWKRPFADMLLWAMYRFFRLCCGVQASWLPDFAAYFRRLGYLPRKTVWRYLGFVEGIAYLKIRE